MKEDSTWGTRVKDTWTRAGIAWERWDPVLSSSMSAVDPFLIRALRLRPGHRVLDVGCGFGEPALAIAPLVEPGGSVLGADLSGTMIATARRRARMRGIRNATFRVADAAKLSPAMRFDAIVSRYGMMFPEDTPAMLAGLHRHLRPGGRVAFAVWGPRRRNPYFDIAYSAAEPFLPEPPRPPEEMPHALRFARPAPLLRWLEEIGFRDVRREGVRTPFTFVNPEQYAQVVLEVSGSMRDLMSRIGASKRQRVVDRLLAGGREYRQGAMVRMPGFAWVISARR